MEVKKKEIETIDGRINTAKQQKQAEEKLTLERRRAEELELELIERRHGMRAIESDHAAMRRGAARARATACARERSSRCGCACERCRSPDWRAGCGRSRRARARVAPSLAISRSR